MRIAQVAPLAESVPPKLYGGTERVVSWLTDRLVEDGHDVTLFATGDSNTSAKLVPAAPRGLRLDGVRDHIASTLVMLDQVRRRADEFDIIHFHVDLLHFPLFRDLSRKSVTTLHGRLDLPDCHAAYCAFPFMPLISISDDQRAGLPVDVNWIASIHHGMPARLCRFSTGPGEYLAFLGRITPDKRPDRAIEIARRSGIPLKIAAKVDPADGDYFEQVIRPLLCEPQVEYLGEVDDEAKSDLLGNALALLFPIDWCEPFGLVMIEAMAAGTPVIAWRRGSVPEVIEDGITGMVVNSISGAVEAVQRVQAMSREGVRRRFEERFTDAVMARRYIAAYQQMLSVSEPAPQVVIKPRPAGLTRTVRSKPIRQPPLGHGVPGIRQETGIVPSTQSEGS